jgi:glycosyltransferase involved in cell wall biosynthesis
MNVHNQNSLILAFDAKRLFNNRTGLGNYSRTLVKNLQSLYPEHQYHLFTPNAPKNQETEYFFDESKFVIHTPKRWNPLWRFFAVANQINELSPDIYHGLSHEIPFGINKRTSTVLTFHDLIFEKYPKQFSFWDRNMYHFKYKNAVTRADHIVAISQSTLNDLKTYYSVPQSKMSIVYQSCNELFFTTDIECSNNFKEDLPNDFYLYVGSIIERKGLVQIILAYAKLDYIYRKPLVIIGNGDLNYLKKVKDLIAYYRLQDKILFLKNINNQDLISFYDKCFCLIYPSIYEGFGIPVIESLARKKPVITSTLSSLPEAAGAGGILINPFDPTEIAHAMVRLHQKEIYTELVDKGFHYVQNNFSKQVTSHKMMELYHKVHDQNVFE